MTAKDKKAAKEALRVLAALKARMYGGDLARDWCGKAILDDISRTFACVEKLLNG